MLRNLSNCSLKIVFFRQIRKPSQTLGCRYFGLFSDDILGLEGYKRQRMITRERVHSRRDDFFHRMESYMASGDNCTIFTDDLKTVASLAETDSELDTAVKMIKKYAVQKSLHFGTFQFGPIVMRMFHHLKKPRQALDAFNDSEIVDFYDQMSTYLILMDLLYEHKLYDDVIKVYEEISERLSQSIRFPRDCSTLALAACYKQNTPESYEKAVDIIRTTTNKKADVPVRGRVFGALLCLQHNHANEAFEILATANEDRFIAALNVKAIAYAALNRPDDAISMISRVLYEDLPEHVKSRRVIFPETLEKIESCVNSTDKSDLINKLNTVQDDLRKYALITQQKLHDFIEEPVNRMKNDKNSFKSRERSAVGYIQDSSSRGWGTRGGITDVE
ncbi:pentatricopeptide repeat-containing protein 2, mitochondrial-like [Tubulanus polymorphus]|uniref:pentatricopeptide repeat-containing protein 2, mitochondrial-like n=1 Tax=Tubulanus polymorphus TaxID=672921 RepID=UPI003DA29AF8